MPASILQGARSFSGVVPAMSSSCDDWVSVETSAVAVAPLHTELQKEIDAMQVVYTQEKCQLELLAQELENEVQFLRDHTRCASGVQQPEPQLNSNALPPPRQVSWCLDNIAAMASFHCSAGESARSLCLKKGFRPQECPGVDFMLLFFPSGGELLSLTKPSLCCRLCLEVSGATAVGLQLAVALSINLAVANAGTGDASETSEGEASPPGESIHVASAAKDIHGCGKVHCDAIWPLGVPTSSIICQVELSVRSWNADLYRYETEWLAGCQDLPDEDTDSESASAW